MINQQIHRAYRSLLIHRLRTLLSTLGVLFGVVAVIAMLSIGEGAKQETLEQIQQLGMNTIILRQIDLSEEQQQRATERRSHGLQQEDGLAILRTVANITIQAPIKVIEAGLTGTSQEIAPEILAITPDFQQIKKLPLAAGRFLCDFDSTGKQRVCVIGNDIAHTLGSRGRIGETVRIENAEFRIVGVLAEKRWSEGKTTALTSRNLNKSLFIPLGTERGLPKKTRQRRDYLSEIILQVDSPKEMTQTQQLVQRVLDRTHNQVEDYQVVIPQELLHQATRTQRTFNLVLGSIAAISLLVGGIGIMNIMLATVSERTREIGIRRAVGANQTHIALQFLLETLLLTLTGALLGVVCGSLFSLLIGHVAGWKTIVRLWSVLISLFMASGVGLASGLYPALKAAKMSPITALRSE